MLFQLNQLVNIVSAYQTDSSALWCFCWTDHAPKSVVKLTRLGKFAVTTDGRVDATQVRQCRRESQSEISWTVL